MFQTCDSGEGQDLAKVYHKFVNSIGMVQDLGFRDEYGLFWYSFQDWNGFGS